MLIRSSRWNRIRAGALAFAAVIGMASLPVATMTPAMAESISVATEDQLILKSGRVVNGAILEETDQTITIMVNVSGIKAKTTFSRSEILEIKRAAEKPATEAVKALDSEPSIGEAPVAAPEETNSASSEDENKAKLYLIPLEGRFGFDVATTPLRKAFEEADKYFNDLIPGKGEMQGKMVVDPAKRNLNLIVLELDCYSQPGRGSIFIAESIAPVVKEQIVDKNRRVIFWVKLAIGGGAFLPWISEEIYFQPEGRLGGLGDLDQFSAGDKMVTEKLISATLGHAEGFAVKGGYGAHIPVMRAMFRKAYWLYVKFEGGKPIYLDHELRPEDGDGWILLSDDGEGDNKDTQALVGNDLFILEPDWAEKLGISDGVAETLDDLAFRLGIHQNYIAVEENRGEKAMVEWKDKLDEAVRLVNPEANEAAGLQQGRLWRDYAEIRVQGDYNDRKRQRGRQISLLNQIRGIFSQYREVLDPDGSFVASRIDVMISRLKLEAEQDARAQRQNR